VEPLPDAVAAEAGSEDVAAVIAELEADMTEAAGRLEFERAALLRDQIDALCSGDVRKAALAPRKPAAGRGSGRRR
jgi:excinuclease ABC subunit B